MCGNCDYSEESASVCNRCDCNPCMCGSHDFRSQKEIDEELDRQYKEDADMFPDNIDW
jgi:hypothetical protein